MERDSRDVWKVHCTLKKCCMTTKALFGTQKFTNTRVHVMCLAVCIPSPLPCSTCCVSLRRMHTGAFIYNLKVKEFLFLVFCIVN